MDRARTVCIDEGDDYVGVVRDEIKKVLYRPELIQRAAPLELLHTIYPENI